MQRRCDAPPPDAGDSTPQTLTRATVARMLSCSIAMVRWYQRQKRLNPTVDAHGVWRFDLKEVEQLRRERAHRTRRMYRSPGALAAEVFRLFDEGHSLSGIVITTRLAPELIQTLWLEYKRPLGAPQTSGASVDDSPERDDSARTLDLGTEGHGESRRRY